MNISNSKNYFLLVLILFLFGCTKKEKKTNLAESYYKMALLEISESPEESSLTYKRSLDLINEAIKRDIKPEYLAIKGTLLFKLNQDVVAYKCFNKALRMNVDSKTKMEILNNKACLLAKVGLKRYGNRRNVERAINIWKRLEKDKDYLTSEVALVNQSKVYFLLKKYKKVKEKLLKAINISPNYLDAHYYLALAAYELKDFNLAKNEIDTVLFLLPDHEGARKIKEILEKL